MLDTNIPYENYYLCAADNCILFVVQNITQGKSTENSEDTCTINNFIIFPLPVFALWKVNA